MTTLDSEVRSVVQAFLQSGELFTALDVSNKVKMALPFAKHREVRDVVRGMFTTDIEPAGWARTPITVEIGGGQTAEALLYHPVSATWDLDNLYDAQKRQQSAVHTGSATIPVAAPVVNVPAPAPAAVQQAVVQAQAHDLWSQLFNNTPSLFPRK